MMKIKLTLAIAWVLFPVPICVTMAQALHQPHISIAAERPEPPPRPYPEGREPAGTRSPCENPDTPLSPVLPLFDSDFSGRTLNGHPTFWFYVPYSQQNVSSGYFALEDDAGNTLWSTSFEVPASPGFVSVKIPNTEKMLELNKQYNWMFSLSLSCDLPDDELTYVYQAGEIQRVDRPNPENLKQMEIGERMNFYLNNEMWYDAASDLDELKGNRNYWINLLNSFGMESLSGEAIGGSVIFVEEE